jgi:hypothetical protein
MTTVGRGHKSVSVPLWEDVIDAHTTSPGALDNDGTDCKSPAARNLKVVYAWVNLLVLQRVTWPFTEAT